MPTFTAATAAENARKSHEARRKAKAAAAITAASKPQSPPAPPQPCPQPSPANMRQIRAQERQNTPENANMLTRTRARRRIDATTVNDIARLAAVTLTESEACRLLNILPSTWFEWKSKHRRGEKYGALLETFRAIRIETLIGRIEDASDPTKTARPDWRAAAQLLRYLDPVRFGDNPAVTVNNTVNARSEDRDRTLDLIRRAIARRGVLPAGQPPKQIAAGATIETTASVTPAQIQDAPPASQDNGPASTGWNKD